jgi:hypothetical protein
LPTWGFQVYWGDQLWGRVSSWRGRGLVLPGPVVWQMLEQLQSVQEGKGHTLEAARTEAQDDQQEHNFLRSEGVGAIAVEGICLTEIRYWGLKLTYPKFGRS